MKKSLSFLVGAVLLFGLAACTERERDIPVLSVTVTPTELTLQVGTSSTLAHTVYPSDATNRSVRWETANPAIATVDNGRVTAVEEGTTTITVITECGDRRNTATVTVVRGVTGVALSTNADTRLIGETLTLVATLTPENATNQNVRWESDHSNIASVDNNGVVTMVGAGTTRIRVFTEDGNHEAWVEVRAVDGVRFAGTVTLPAVAHTTRTEAEEVFASIIWARNNVDAAGQFTTYPHEPGTLFQWGRSASFPLSGDVESWGNTPAVPGTIRDALWIENSPCPTGWRMPTEAEARALLAAGVEVAQDWNQTGINGRLFGTYPNQIFLPHRGRLLAVGGGHTILSSGYWINSLHPQHIGMTDADPSMAWFLQLPNVVTSASTVIGLPQASGLSVRCVAIGSEMEAED